MLKNYFLLFHKCGNNYATNVHEIDKKTAFVKDYNEMKIDSYEAISSSNQVVNIRCRNFGLNDVEEFNLLETDARFLVFTRNPASFIISAMTYHLKGSEEWARTVPQKQFNGMTLTGALNNASSDDEKYIITMKHFSRIYRSQASLAKCFHMEQFKQIKTEELFTTTDLQFYKEIATFLRLEHNQEFLNALMESSPSFKSKLPGHSTGSFKISNPSSVFKGEAREYFNQHFYNEGKKLGYN